jgi:hypothetical protein
MDLWTLRRLVSQRSLKSCRLEFEDRPLEDASLFPLFDEEGRTRMVMITAEENARIMLADWAPDLFGRNWPWRKCLHLRFADLADASVWDEEHLHDLWHFDPWWVLGDERYQGHGSVPGLQSTNIPGYDPTVSDIVFSAGLERASYVVKASGGQSVKVRRFTADTLVAMAQRRQATPERPRATVATWRLRPLWRFR